MPPVKIHSSNRMEVLAEALAASMACPPSRPLEKEVVVTQTLGMKRWVSLELARHRGICANVEFSLPRKFVHGVLARDGTCPSGESIEGPRAWTWKIMRLLGASLAGEGFEALQDYLRDDDALKRFQLAELVADTFDQYSVYRPEMVLQWESGTEDHWQARLWRACAAEEKKPHAAALWKDFSERARRGSLEGKGLPSRVFVFGISALPPFYLHLFSTLSAWMETHFFVLNPCREYWGDLLSGREQRRLEERGQKKNIAPEALHLSQANSLLASWGRYGRDFLDMLLELDGEEEEKFIHPEGDSLLFRLQGDILNLREPREAGGKILLAPDDRSVQIHSCHGPLREMEVLRDNLLSLFASDPGLAPGDVLVMAPDIEKYAPFIQAVFGAPEEGLRIPFRVSDRNLRNESRIIRAFFSLLDLAGSRLGAAQVLDLLEIQALRDKLGFTSRDMETVKRWVASAGIRWGVNQEHRRRLGPASFPDNTWQWGMERLFLGYALEAGREALFQGILPLEEMDGTEALLLGNFTEFLDRLFRSMNSLDKKRSMKEWAGEVKRLLHDFFEETEDTQRELQSIREAMDRLRTETEASSFDEVFDLSVLRAALERRLKREVSGAGFISGQVTFCAMMPMRSIPFPVICLLGMDGDAFPRSARGPGFDLMARNPRRGDRSLGQEDRFIFLEALLSARRNLLISYVGQNIRDNSPLPPSLVVSELLDAVEQGYATPGGISAADRVTTRHRLQAFHPSYYRGEGPTFSFSRENFEAARQREKGEESGRADFISSGLSSPGEEWREVTLEGLERFFANPACFLLKQRLGIRLEERPKTLREKEPFLLEGLERYGLAQDLVSRALAGEDMKSLWPLARASGDLPHGSVGERIFEETRSRVESFLPAIRCHRGGPLLDPLPVEIRMKGFCLRGRVDNLWRDRHLIYRAAPVKPGDRITAWVRHLALNLAAQNGTPRATVFVGEDATLIFKPLSQAAPPLLRLLELYWQGLQRPLPFFPLSSWTYARTILRGKTEGEALAKARQAWNGSEFSPRPERKDPYFHLCFGKTDSPLGVDFQKTALEVFGPLEAFLEN